MDTVYYSNLNTQSCEHVAGLSDGKAYDRFLSDMKAESPMSVEERKHFVEILRQQGRSLNHLMEFPVLELQL
jgi:hypothetical protein